MMSKNEDHIGQASFRKKPMLFTRGQIRERFIVIKHDWFIPVQTLRRLHLNNTQNVIESIPFPNDEAFDSDWQFYVEHQIHPPRIRIGLILLEPHGRCIHADIKLMFISTQNEQVIKEQLFSKHIFFVAKGESLSSYMNEHISPKIYFDIEDELYENVMNGIQKGNEVKTNDCMITAQVRLIDEFDIEPKPKAYDFARRFKVDWKLLKFHRLIEQINQSKAPVNNVRRIFSDRFRFTHSKLADILMNKKWKLLIHYPQAVTIDKHTPLYVTLKSLYPIPPNYGKYEIICQNEHHILRRYSESMEDLTDIYAVEFFTLDQLSANIYHYKQNFDKNNGRVVSIEYILLSIQIVQPIQGIDILKKIKPITEPTLICLSTLGKSRNKKDGNVPKDPGAKSPNPEEKKALRSPASRENTTTRISNDHRLTNHTLPPINFRNNSPIRLRSSSSVQVLRNMMENQMRISNSFMYKAVRTSKPSSTVPSASTITAHSDLTDNFTFLTNLFRSGLHSDVTVRHLDHHWRLHKSILSARSIYFHQYFSKSQDLELDLSDDKDIVSSIILDKMFFYIYTNQYALEKIPRLTLFESTRLLFALSIKFGISILTRLCLQDMCNMHHLSVDTAAYLLVAVNQASNGPYERYHSNEYLAQVKDCKQTVLRFIQIHSREVLSTSQWKQLEKQYPTLVHDVLEFVVFEKF